MADVASARPRRVASRARSAPDRVTVMLVTVAVFLTVLSVLAGRLRAAAPAAAPAHRILVVRRVYETRIVDDRGSPRGSNAATVSVSTSGGGAAPAAPSTRTSVAR